MSAIPGSPYFLPLLNPAIKNSCDLTSLKLEGLT